MPSRRPNQTLEDPKPRTCAASRGDSVRSAPFDQQKPWRDRCEGPFLVLRLRLLTVLAAPLFGVRLPALHRRVLRFILRLLMGRESHKTTIAP